MRLKDVILKLNINIAEILMQYTGYYEYGYRVRS